ncbi:autoinducer 2 ABC transporter substrate-binding protein [Paenibacillus abyssi]|uniref:Sugar ABC transporter substrate-binding protein n=1 Tax=Paenibacillus abyssi TaxID=1340531 RepID=A0A917CXX7_9BACL|nr:autoinducer 2 ABC transporter substrate-binding protein [Paenibacillus abyssi]GGG01430.1 sugar ABC transporter substrate-binding protein [Paenibacillus abyssi]
MTVRWGVVATSGYKLLTLCFIAILFVSGCGTEAANSNQDEVVYVNEDKEERIAQRLQDVQSKPYTIAVVPKLTGISYYEAAEEGAMEAAEDLNVNVIFTGPPVGDVTLQMKVIEELIARKVDAIAVSANDPFKLLPVLKKAREQNIKVITWDGDTDPIGREFFVNMVDPQTLGRHLMDNLALSLNEKGKFAIITSSLTASNTTDWIKWIKIQQKEYYPEMKLTEIVSSNDSYDNAYEAAKYLMNEYPDLSGIIGVSAVAPSAAAKAIQAAGKSNSVKVVGLSLPNAMRDYIKEGVTPNITLWSPQRLGYLTVALAKNLLDGEFPYDQQEIPKVGNIRVKDNVVIMGVPIVFTKENIDQYDF